MKKLSQRELNTIEKFCGVDYVKKLKSIQEKQKDNKVRVVNTGMVSSGKSSLYNTLINSTEEYFPTVAARTTVKANYFGYNNILYVDTPGIDVRCEDDALAFNTIMESDIIMMIHNIRTGPLNKSEVEWLKNITYNMGSVEMCQARIIFVISWKDTREKDTDYPELIKNLKTQIFEIVGGEVPVFEVSVRKYQQGKEKNKDILVQRSGVMELKDYLEKYAEEYLKKKDVINVEEYKKIMIDARRTLQNELNIRKEKVDSVHRQVRNNYKSKKNAWNEVFEYFQNQRRKLTSLENELRNI